MSYKVCMAIFAVEENESVQKWTKFSSGSSSILVPTLELKGKPDDIEEQLEDICKKLIQQMERLKLF